MSATDTGKSCDMRIFLYRRHWLLKYLLRWVRVSTLERPPHLSQIGRLYDPIQDSLCSNRYLAKRGMHLRSQGCGSGQPHFALGRQQTALIWE
jgi:hypothetical protein